MYIMYISLYMYVYPGDRLLHGLFEERACPAASIPRQTQQIRDTIQCLRDWSGCPSEEGCLDTLGCAFLLNTPRHIQNIIPALPQ